MIGLLLNPTKADVSPEGLLPHEGAMQPPREDPHQDPPPAPRPARAPEAPSQRLESRRHRLPRTASRLARIAPGWRLRLEQQAHLSRSDR